MSEKPLFTQQSLRELIDRGEGQFVELKSLWDRQGGQPRPLGRSTVRDMVAKYVAAFANADGGVLVLGVDDDGIASGHEYPADAIDGFIAVASRKLRPPVPVDHQQLALDGQPVIVISVGRTPTTVQVEGDGYPCRRGDQVVHDSEVRIDRVKEEYASRGVEQRFADTAALDDLDLSALPADLDREAWLEARGVVLPRYGSAAVTRAGAMLFGRPPVVQWHARMGVRIFRVDGVERRPGANRNVTRVAHLERPLAALIPAAYEAVRQQVRRSERLHSLFFREVPEYPTFAWQEAIVNAVAHRDYRDEGREIEVWLFDDRMEVRSPGGLVPPVTVEALRQRTPVHASRNPIIARVLVELGLMREEGEGIPRMFEEMERSLLHPPLFDVADGDTFVVTLRNTPILESPDGEWRHIVERLDLAVPQKRALVAHPEGFTNEQFRAVNDGIDRDEAYRLIQEMVSAGVVERASGPGRGAIYRVTADVLDSRAWLGQRLPALRVHFEEHDALANTDYRTLFGVTRSEALRELTRLTDQGLLRRVGERRGSRYLPGASLR